MQNATKNEEPRGTSFLVAFWCDLYNKNTQKRKQSKKEAIDYFRHGERRQNASDQKTRTFEIITSVNLLVHVS